MLQFSSVFNCCQRNQSEIKISDEKLRNAFDTVLVELGAKDEMPEGTSESIRIILLIQCPNADWEESFHTMISIYSFLLDQRIKSSFQFFNSRAIWHTNQADLCQRIPCNRHYGTRAMLVAPARMALCARARHAAHPANFAFRIAEGHSDLRRF